MEILYLLIPFSVALVFFIGAAFWWFLRSGQFDDLEGPAYRILMDRDAAAKASMEKSPGETGTEDGNHSKTEEDGKGASARVE